MRKFLLFMLFFAIKSFSQIDKFNTSNLHPVSPAASQFVKYTEVPISEYTGLPNIAIPIYTIEVDGFKFPIQATYHAQGIRVTQEASSIGLGWDLSFGSIVQHINDRDDFGTDPFSPLSNKQNVRLLPDYFGGNGAPAIIPHTNICGLNGGAYQPYPINSPQPTSGYAIATDYDVPINGQFWPKPIQLFNDRWYDSEPDIFVASFFGEIIKFIYDGNSLIVLNKKGCKVFKTNNGFKIITLNGLSYFFELKKETKTYNYSFNILQNGSNPYNSSFDFESTTNIFYLTKVVTPNNKEIFFEYEQGNDREVYPSYSDKLQALTTNTIVSDAIPVCLPGVTGFEATINGNVLNTSTPISVSPNYSFNKESDVVIKKIRFEGNSINFVNSLREDLNGAKKIDKIELVDYRDIFVKKWEFNYSYFNSSSVISNGYMHPNGSSLAGLDVSNLRLKLNSIKINGFESFDFNYNSQILPPKNSFAQDYWGFYNGELSNANLVPKPTGVTNAALTNINNNRNANLNFTKASILEEIIYPTGGKASYNYELNQFNSENMTGISTTPTTVNGFGLRLKNYKLYDNFQNSINLTKDFSYYGGKLINPQRLTREINVNDYKPQPPQSRFISVNATLFECSANGIFSPNPLSAHNTVGYDSVTIYETNTLNSQTNGKRTLSFFNNSNIVNSVSNTYAVNAGVPYYRNIDEPENGNIKKINVYNSQGVLINQNINTYEVNKSDIYYGARLFFYRYLQSGNFDNTYELFVKTKHLIAYYPIFDTYTRLRESNSKTWDANGKMLQTKKIYTYDEFNQITSIQDWENISGNKGWTQTYLDYPYNTLSTVAGSNDLFLSNQNSTVTQIRKVKYPPTYSPNVQVYWASNEHKIVGNNIVPSKINEKLGNASSSRVLQEYNKYDLNGNLLQVKEKNGLIKDYIRDYNNLYNSSETVFGKLNGDPEKQSFATSFEADGKGNFTFDGIPDLSIDAFTGNRIYDLSKGSISAITNSPQTMVISMWAKSNAINIAKDGVVITSSPRLGDTRNGFTLFQWEVTNPAIITISGTAIIDELRVYPKNAFMNTYTYEPLIGITSETDANNKTTYYEYDGANKLALVKDFNKNILKQLCYKYYNQPENCSVNYYLNDAISLQFQKNNCPSGYLGSSVTFGVPANVFKSTISKAHANASVISYLNQYGQIFANSSGSGATCTYIDPCNGVVCSNIGEKCINGVCESGIKVYTNSWWDAYQWICEYHYEFSDGSWSPTYQETSAGACFFN